MAVTFILPGRGTEDSYPLVTPTPTPTPEEEEEEEEEKEAEGWTDWLKTFGESVILSPGGTPVGIAELGLSPEALKAAIFGANYFTIMYNDAEPTLSPGQENPYENVKWRWQDKKERPEPGW